MKRMHIKLLYPVARQINVGYIPRKSTAYVGDIIIAKVYPCHTDVKCRKGLESLSGAIDFQLIVRNSLAFTFSGSKMASVPAFLMESCKCIFYH